MHFLTTYATPDNTQCWPILPGQFSSIVIDGFIGPVMSRGYLKLFDIPLFNNENWLKIK